MRDVERGREIAAAQDAGIIAGDIVARGGACFGSHGRKERTLTESQTARSYQTSIQEIPS
jgi:hypothetical protein